MGASETLVRDGAQRYDPDGLLGQGGMGAVYRVLDRHRGEVVALKRLIVSAAEKRALLTELFHQEFRTLVQLAHPHVVRAHDFGIDDQGPYYTMELLDGDDLHGLSPLPWRQACNLLRDVCSAIALLHSRRLLHRDLSPKNIKRTRNGRAKLLDFGAMAAMGPCKTVVGTLPLVPPEALLKQPLDGRADLYALGGTLYYALTGSHAYPARIASQLEGLWRKPLLPPSTRAPDVPAELDALVMSLLSIDAVARPRSAAEVIDRLTAIAGLSEDEQLAVSHAYLTTPELVGRAAQLARVRVRLGELIASRGGAIAVEGAPGMGRTRMLDTIVLEARLAGISVARASAGDATKAYGTVGALLRELRDITPGAAAGGDGARSLFEQGEISVDTDKSRRAELQKALIDALHLAAATQPVVLAIDDLERCDEPSQAALAAAAQASRRDRVVIAATLESGAEQHSPALSLLCQSATRIELTPLPQADTEALLGSVFGDVPYLHGLAARIHARAEGSPRGCMELAQHLSERGIVTYRMGSWILPPDLDDAALPSSLSRARRMKLDALSEGARELGEVLAVAEGSGLSFEDLFPEDRESLRSALDELLHAHVLRIEGMHYAFEAKAWIEELCAGVEPERARAICLRVAQSLERRGRDRLDVARFLSRAGEAARMVDTLLAELALGTRWDRCPRDYGEILKSAVDACDALGRCPRDRFVLLSEIVRLGTDLALSDMRARLAELFSQLRQDSGLSDWQRLDPGLEPMARLQRAVELAQARHDAAPANARGLQPLEAVIALARLVADTVAIAAQIGDHSMFGLLPPLEPFFPLSPVIKRLDTLSIPASKCVVAGRYELARELYKESLAALLVPGGLDDELRVWGIRALHYAIGSIEAGLGREPALRHAEELERASGWEVPAWTVRLSYHLTIGNLREADRCRSQIELLLLQSPVKPQLSAGAVHQHVFAFSLSDDLTGMRRAIPEMEKLARSHPTLAPFVPFTRAEHARICGNYDEAIARVEETLSMIAPGEHPLWPWAVGCRLTTLLALKRTEEAYALAKREFETATVVGLQVMKDHIELPLALIEAELGHFDSACERLDRISSRRADTHMQGVTLGWAYEARARVALAMGDAQSFTANAQLCAQQYRRAEGDPALAAKYERLMQDARTRGVLVQAELEDALAPESTDMQATEAIVLESSTAAAVHALSACGSADERAERALRLILDSAGAVDGELYLLEGDALRLAAASREGLGNEQTRVALLRLIDAVCASQSVLTSDSTRIVLSERPAPRENVTPLLLKSARSEEGAVAGVAVLHFASDEIPSLPTAIAAIIADLLINAGDARLRAIADTTPIIES
jgi:serine/threonine-protein kinase